MNNDKRVLQLLYEESCTMHRIKPDMRLAMDLGLTASERISLAFRVKQEFGIHLDDSHYDAITNHRATVSDVLAVVRCLTTNQEPA